MWQWSRTWLLPPPPLLLGRRAREDGGAEGGDPKLKSKRLLALKRAKQREPEESAFERDLRAKAELEAARFASARGRRRKRRR